MPAVADLGRRADDLRAGRYLRVVNYRNTPAGMAGQLERELAAYAQRFASVTFDDLERFFDTGTWGLERPGFLPVFYEGYRNNAEVAAPICNELGVVGWFLVAKAFIDPVP